MTFDENSLYNVISCNDGDRYSLYDLAIWKNGLAFKKINFSDTGIPVIKIAELNNGIGATTAYTNQTFSEDVHLHNGDLLFSWSGNPDTSIDIYRFQLNEGWLNQHIFKVTPNEQIVDRDYFYFLMKLLKPIFTKIATNIGNKAHKNELAKTFKDNNSPLKIAIVVDMWLTGFDVPSLATMYVYKPMSGYNLMQAIARVNRVFRDKEGGLVVDYVGIASALKQAMNDYTVRDRKNYGDTDVGRVAYPKFLEKLSRCQDLFHGYDYHNFNTGSDLDRAKTISGAVNFIIAPAREADKEEFLKEALMLHQSLSLCSSLVDEQLRIEAAFFEAVRVLVMRLSNQGTEKKISLPEMNARINELLKHSIKSDGVINLFSDVKEEFSLFDPKFLEDVAKMKEKNLAVELLKKLIAEQIHIYRRTNVVKSEKFSEIIQRTMNAYLNGMLTNEQVIEELMKMAKDISNAAKEGEELGLTADELAFYDALTKPQAVKDFYENSELIAISKELTETLRKNKTIDWQKKDSARARMRMLIKKLLKSHRYPPEGMEDAVQTVMTQCELWTDNVFD